MEDALRLHLLPVIEAGGEMTERRREEGVIPGVWRNAGEVIDTFNV